MAAEVYFKDLHLDVLVELHHVGGMVHPTVGKLGDVHEAVLMDTDVYESSEVRDVRDDAGKNHSWGKILDFVDAAVEAELLKLLSRVTARLLQLEHDVLQGGQSYGIGGVALDVYA